MKRFAFGLILLGSAGLASAAPTLTLSDTPLWRAAPGDVNYPFIGGANTNTERGLAYNPKTGNVYVASRQAAPNKGIFVLNGQTGALIGKLNISGIAGSNPGGFEFNMIDVDDDGRIYAANLTTGSTGSPFKIYRWASEQDALESGGNQAAANVYSGDPTGGATPPAGTNFRYGDSFDVIGGGENVRVIAGTRVHNRVGVFVSNGDTLAALNVNTDYSSHLGLGWHDENNYWTKVASVVTGTVVTTDNPLRLVQVDLTNSTGTTAATSSVPGVNDATTAPLGASSGLGLLGLINYGTTTGNPSFILYDITDPGSVAEITRRSFGTVNANGNGVGDVEFGGNAVYALDPNNGIVAYSIVPIPEPVSLAFLGFSALLLRRRSK